MPGWNVLYPCTSVNFLLCARRCAKFWHMMMNRPNIVCYFGTPWRRWACGKDRGKTNREGRSDRAKWENITGTLTLALGQGAFWKEMKHINKSRARAQGEGVYSERREQNVQKPQRETRPCAFKEMREVEHAWVQIARGRISYLKILRELSRGQVMQTYYKVPGVYVWGQ